MSPPAPPGRAVSEAVIAVAQAVTLSAGLVSLPSFGGQITSYARMLSELAPR
jgi:hypothetical protein